MEHLDLLFARVGDIDKNQQKLDAQVGMTNKVVEQMLLDQQMLANRSMQQARRWPNLH